MLAGIAVIILLTTRYRLPAFFAMLIACFVTGLGVQLSLPELIGVSKTGFGNTMQSLGFLIVLGTLLGLLLEHTGSTRVMAAYILKKAGEKALEAIHKVSGVVTPFDVCSAGSKPETRFPWIGPTTNHPYCPSLKQRLSKASMVPEGVRYIPEIVINGVSIESAKEAVKAGIEAVLNVDGVMRVSAGNYGGKLGEFKIYLRELFL